MSRFESVWGFLDFDHETDDLKKQSDYLILIQARINGMGGGIKYNPHTLFFTSPRAPRIW